MEATANYYFVFTSVSVFTFASLGLCRLKSVLKQLEPSRLASINSHDGGSAVNLGVDQKYQPLLPHVEGKNAPILGSSGEFVEIEVVWNGNRPLPFQVSIRTTWYFLF